MITHGLLICSFYLKKKYSRSENEILQLNQEYEYDGTLYNNVFSLFNGFVQNYMELADDEKMMKMFAIDYNSVKYEEKDGYTIESGIIHSGAYGTESEITNKTTKEVVYRRGKDDADIKQFDYMIFVPSDEDDKKVTKGIILFETIGTYGVKTITTRNMKGFFSEKYGLTLETRSISVRIFMEKLLKDNKLNRVTLIKNSVSKDPADNMFANVGREELTYISPKLKDSWILQLLEHLDGTSDDDIFEVNNEVYEDIKLTFSHAGRTKTVRLNDVDRFSMIEDIPDYIYNGNNIDREKLVKHMEKTAQDYAGRMIFVHK